jgi:hypothetical protein
VSVVCSESMVVWFVTDVPGQQVGPMFKVQGVLEECWYSWMCEYVWRCDWYVADRKG